MSEIVWTRAAGHRSGDVLTAYDGVTPEGAQYLIESKFEPEECGRRFRAYRVTPEGRYVPAAEGGPLRTLPTAKAQAERDLADLQATPRGTLRATMVRRVTEHLGRQAAERSYADGGRHALRAMRDGVADWVRVDVENHSHHRSPRTPGEVVLTPEDVRTLIADVAREMGVEL